MQTQVINSLLMIKPSSAHEYLQQALTDPCHILRGHRPQFENLLNHMVNSEFYRTHKAKSVESGYSKALILYAIALNCVTSCR